MGEGEKREIEERETKERESEGKGKGGREREKEIRVHGFLYRSPFFFHDSAFRTFTVSYYMYCTSFYNKTGSEIVCVFITLLSCLCALYFHVDLSESRCLQ